MKLLDCFREVEKIAESYGLFVYLWVPEFPRRGVKFYTEIKEIHNFTEENLLYRGTLDVTSFVYLPKQGLPTVMLEFYIENEIVPDTDSFLKNFESTLIRRIFQ